MPSTMNTSERKICEAVGLTPSLIDTLNIDVSTINMRQSSVIFTPGDSCKAFLILCSGSVRVELTAKSGREVMLYRIQPTEGCILTTSALLNNELYYAQGVTESDISAIAVSTEGFYKAIQYSQKFANFVLVDYAKRVSSIVRLVDRMATRNAMQDVCEYLTIHADRNNMVMTTQNHIASEIGTAREVVGRKLRHLVNEDVISVKRGKIFIEKPEKLNTFINE